MDDKITIRKFNGKNFPVWKAQISAVLLAKDLFSSITDARPPDESQQKDWDKMDRQAKAYLLSSLDDKHAGVVLHLATSKSIWDKLCSIHDNKVKANKMVLQSEFFALKMKPGEKMDEYVGRAVTMAEQLKSIGVKLEDSSVAANIVSGLPSKYCSFISTWNSTSEGEQTLTNLEPRLISEEQMLNRFSADDSNALFSSSRSYSKVGTKVSVQKSKSQQPTTSTPKTQVKKNQCLHCKKMGHWKRECPDLISQGTSKTSTKSNDDDNSVGSAILAESNCVDGCGDWVLDSGASEHMSYDRSTFIVYKELDQPKPVRFGNNQVGAGVGLGEIKVVSTLTDGKERVLTLTKVLHVPEIRRKLLSVSAATKTGSIGEINEDQIILRDSLGHEQLVGKRFGNLYRVSLQELIGEADLASHTNELDLWHERFGHINKRTILEMSKNESVLGLPCLAESAKRASDSRHVISCDACSLGKQAKKSFPARTRKRAQTVGERLHVDLCTIGAETVGGCKYFVLFKDEFSNYRHVYCIKTKDEAFDSLRKCVAQIRSDTGQDVRCIVSDCGSEFVSKRAQEFMLHHKIGQELSAPFTPEQNGVIERDNRTVVESVRTMLLHRRLPESLWGEAVNTAIYLLNRSNNRVVGNETPFRRYFGVRPKVSHLRVFGSLAMVKQQHKKRSGYQRKLEPRAKPLILVGYDKDFTYRLYDHETRKVIISREVSFDESRTIKGFSDPVGKYEYLSIAIESQPIDKEVPNTDITECLEEQNSEQFPDLDNNDLCVNQDELASDKDDENSVMHSACSSPVGGVESNQVGSTPAQQQESLHSSGYNLRPRKQKDTPMRQILSKFTGGGSSSYAEAMLAYGDEPDSYESAMSSADSKLSDHHYHG